MKEKEVVEKGLVGLEGLEVKVERMTGAVESGVETVVEKGSVV